MHLKTPMIMNKKPEILDLFGEKIEQNELLRDKFLEPPFSLLDGRSGDWQARKKKWNALGIRSELGRDAECMPGNFGGELDENGLDKYGRKPMSGTSIFDPALCELMYRWFCPPGGHIGDSFAGGSVRGIVAGYLGYRYTGHELRPEQVNSNREQAEEIKPQVMPLWVPGDTDVTMGLVPPETYDMLFSCPPYHDLEVYSDDPSDLSNMDYDKFLLKYHSIIRKSLLALKENRFAVFVVGDLRDRDGFYKGFNTATKNCFIRNGAKLYNECKLMQPLGTAMLRANKIFGSNKKVIKVHEDVLIFYKGDPRKIKDTFKTE